MTKPPRFDLPDLRLFVAVVEAGSLSRGAARLPLALSAASARLSQLEHRLGQTLLRRHAQGITPTTAGQLFFDYARRVVQAAQETQRCMDQLAADGRVVLTVLSNTTGANSGLPLLLGRFLRAYPGVDLRLAQQSSSMILKAVVAGEADVGIVDGDYHAPDLLRFPFRRDRLVVLTPMSAAAAPACRFAEVLAQPLVGLVPDSSLQLFIERMAVLAQLPARFRAHAPTFAAAAQFVAEGVGWTILPEAPARRYLAAFPLAMRELSEPWAERELQICVRPLEDVSAPAWRLAAYLAGVEGLPG